MINNYLNTRQCRPKIQKMHAAHSELQEAMQNESTVNFLQQSASFLGANLSQEELIRRYL